MASIIADYMKISNKQKGKNEDNRLEILYVV